jgi:hypothetical protein
VETLEAAKPALAATGNGLQNDELGHGLNAEATLADHHNQYGAGLAVTLERHARVPRQSQIDWLCANGVESIAIAKTWRGAYDFIYTAEVVFHHDHFEFERRYADEGFAKALLFLARHENRDPLDIVAWQPLIGYLVPWLGRASVLGAENLRVFHSSPGPTIRRSPLEWLRHRRHGLVIVDEAKARRFLLDHGGPFCADNRDHGLELERALTFKPEILVPEEVSA